MSILIKGMEMPTCCAGCIVACGAKSRTGFIRPFAERLPDCPLVPVPPHGRLIDADALTNSFNPSDFWNPDAEDNCFAAIHVVNCAPTIIEAEEGET